MTYYKQDLDQDDINPNEEYAEASEMSVEDRQFLPSLADAEETTHSRRKRYSDDEMNIWYSEAQDPYHTKSSSEENGKLVGMVRAEGNSILSWLSFKVNFSPHLGVFFNKKGCNVCLNEC